MCDGESPTGRVWSPESCREAWLGTLARTVRAKTLKVYFTTALNICMRLQKSIKSIFGIAT